MSLKAVSTVDLVRELLARVEHVDAALSLLQGGALARDMRPAQEPKPDSRGEVPGRTRGKTRCRRAAVVDVVRKAGIPLTVVHVKRQFPGASRSAISAHLARAVSSGLIKRIGDSTPFTYTLANGASK